MSDTSYSIRVRS